MAVNTQLPEHQSHPAEAQPAKAARERRRVVLYVPLASAIFGMVLVFAAVVALTNDYAKIAVASVGLLAFLAGIWYAAHPYFANERRNWALRAEVSAFMKLVRALHRSRHDPDAAATIERLRSEMHASVDRMADLSKIRTDQAAV